MTETYGLLVLSPLRFRSTLMKRGIFLFGARLSLLIVTPAGTYVGSKRLSIYDFIPTTSKGIMESKSRSLDTHDQTKQKPISADLRGNKGDFRCIVSSFCRPESRRAKLSDKLSI